MISNISEKKIDTNSTSLDMLITELSFEIEEEERLLQRSIATNLSYNITK